MLPAPHGGTLVERRLSPPAVQEVAAGLPRLPRLEVTREQAYDIVNVATGAFSPLQGFMGEAEVEAVIRTGRLPDGVPWTSPIVLDADEEVARRGGDVGLLTYRDRPL